MYRFSLLLFLIALVNGCVDLEPDPTADFDEFMTAKVRGNDFKATEVSLSFSSGNLLTINGLSADSTKILIELSDITKIGTFDLANGQNYEVIYIDANKREFTSKRTLVGTVEITSLTQVTVVGSFSFDGKNNVLGRVSISEGKFAAARN